ncbi:MAG: HU family DNA-binding protein [Prevotella sp.]|nr:HU family DNA-binding protein [Prevotella sp.]MDY4150116.1 HU family DNA-binding protein [Prevotella sp.]
MSKVSITELASKLMEKHGLKRTEAELFIRQFVGVINDGLKNDKSVKVKGLGTFKVHAVSARKSVDVNTGEAIVIEGRDKISFTAEAVMRDLVNAPFAQFETVIVNDGVDFSEIDAKNQADNTEAKEPTPAVEPTPVAEPEPAVVEPTPVAEPEPTVVEAVPAAEPEPTVEPAPAAEPEPTVEPAPVAEPEPAVVEPTPIVEPTPAVEDSDSDTDELEAKSKSYKNTIIVLASSLACVVILAVVGFVYMFSQIEKRDNRIAHLETQTATLADRMMKTHMSPAPAANQPAANDEADNILAANEQKIEAAQKADKENNLKTAEAKPEPKAEPKAATKPTAEAKAHAAKSAPSILSQSAYDKDPRVRTGAYVITGIANTVTVKAGQTMSSLSKTYLGPGMECYLEAVNGGNRELKAGEKIKIPALKTKKSLKK